MDPEEYAEVALDLSMAVDTLGGLIALCKAEGYHALLAEHADDIRALAKAVTPEAT